MNTDDTAEDLPLHDQPTAVLERLVETTRELVGEAEVKVRRLRNWAIQLLEERRRWQPERT
jgi:hypothetical protein